MITIFTPTYNRAHLLTRLYESILQQRYEDFEWLIVDDGSTDGTGSLIEGFIADGKIKIRYFYKDNGGKHTAINLGLQKAEGALFFIVDSDDVLAEDALLKMDCSYQSIKDDSQVCGIIGLSQYLHRSEIVGDRFLQEQWKVGFADVYLKYHLKGDKSVAFKTEIIKKYPFPEKQGIRFVFEAVVWHEMSKKYDVLAVNEVIQYVEYQSFGLSSSSYNKNYIRGLAFSYFQLIKNKTYPLQKYPRHFLWNYIHLGINSLLSGTDYFKQLSLPDQMLYVLCYPRACYTYFQLKGRLND